MRAVGIDISKWQSTYKPNDEAKFVIMRSGYGLMPDKCFEDFYDAAYLANMPIGAYHYFSSGSPWKAQVDFFLEQVDGKVFSKFALDFETGYNSMSRNFALCAVKWIDTVAAETGIEPLLYTSPYTYRDNLLAHTKDVSRFKLWIAQYPSRSWNSYLQTIAEKLTGEPWLKPTGRSDWAFWQFTDKGDGKKYGVGSASVDLNIMNGTESFISDSTPEPPNDPPATKPIIVKGITPDGKHVTITVEIEQ